MRKKLFASLASVFAVTIALTGCAASTEQSSSETTSTDTVTAEAVTQERVYVTPDWLKSAMDGNQAGYEDVQVYQVVYAEPALADTYNKEHIAGASYIFDVDVEDADGTEERPYNLLPDDELEACILARGIDKDTKVVLYGADISGTARVAYALLYGGVEDVKVVNGGLDAWTAAGYETDSTEVTFEAASSFGTTFPAHPEYWTSMDEAKEKLTSDSNFKLVSIRSEEEWLGETSGYNYITRAGEPEGAVWGKGAKSASDVDGFTNSDGTVKELEEILAGDWSDVDFTTDNFLAFYCGTGWRAAVPFLVMYQEGFADSISMYDGGWYQWQMYGDNPVQVGDPASADCVHTTVSELPTDKAAE